jgi:hypothetical protein
MISFQYAPYSIGGSVQMHVKRLIISSLILLACFAANAQAVQDAGSVSTAPGQSLADKLIEESNTGAVYKNDYGFAPTPQKQRELEKNKSSMNWTMPSTLSGGGDSAKSSRDMAESTASEAATDTAAKEAATAIDTSATTQSELPPSEPTATSVSGSWSFTLVDSVQRDLALSMFQNGGDIFGVGNIREGNSTLQVAASGSVQDETMDINIISLGTIGLYKLKLDLNGESVTGDYQAFYANGESLTGSAEGLKTA